MNKFYLLFSGCLIVLNIHAQFAPQVGIDGTTAIHKDSSVFKAWATGCTLNLGWQNIANTSLGKAQVGDATYIIGEAGNGVASLGDAGEAILTFGHPIINGEGYDFAVFENGFIDQTLAPGTAFLELAFVEVSSDGINFTRFPATSLTDTNTQIGTFQGTIASQLNNLAGKYLGNYGTPFDLDELKDVVGLDVNKITHIKIIDVVGSIQNAYASFDAQGNKVNDPWPTAFASSGFDLDGVGVIHQDITQSIQSLGSAGSLHVFPNPASVNQFIFIDDVSNDAQITVYDLLGNEISNYTSAITNKGFGLQFIQSGMYQLVLKTNEGILSKRILIN
jgi:hypothetical protein